MRRGVLSYGDRVIRGMRATGAVVAVLVFASLTSCSAKPTRESTSASPTSSPAAYSSREAASIAFRDHYERYIAVVNSVSANGGKDSSRLKPYVSEVQFPFETKAMLRFVDAGLHSEGKVKVVVFKLRTVNLKSGSGSAYVCVDVKKTRVENAAGKDVTPVDRSPRQAVVIGFDPGPLINSSKAWTGGGVC